LLFFILQDKCVMLRYQINICTRVVVLLNFTQQHFGTQLYNWQLQYLSIEDLLISSLKCAFNISTILFCYWHQILIWLIYLIYMTFDTFNVIARKWSFSKADNFKDFLIDIVKVSLSIMQYNIVNLIKYLQAFTSVYNVQFIYTYIVTSSFV